MKDLLYYPNFESTNETWLKFALLYINKLNPIVPPSGDHKLSALYQKLLNETDLINRYRPDVDQGTSSTIEAIEIAEKIIENPFPYQLMLSQINPVRAWKKLENHTYMLHQEKFSMDWEIFCLSNGFATKVDHGILLPEKLGNIYMIILATTIGDATGKPLITDRNRTDSLSLHLKALAPRLIKEVQIAQSVIGLKLPKGLESIPLDRIIGVRNKPEFKRHLSAFHSEQQNFYQAMEDGATGSRFLEKYERAYNDHLESIYAVGVDTATYGFGAGLVLQSDYIENDFFKVMIAGMGLIIKSTFTLRKSWRSTASHRHCRRYIQDIASLNRK